MNKKTKHWLFYTTIWLIVSLLFFIISVITYQYDVNNCNAFKEIAYEIPQSNIIWCYKIITSPIYSYYIPEALLDLVISGLVVFSIATGRYLWKDMETDDFVEECKKDCNCYKCKFDGENYY